MPDTRCKWYETDGTPVRGGCSTPGCRFVHPGQRGWGSLRPYKTQVRCMFFDSSGRPINGGCRSGSSCRFIHPNDRDWKVAQKPRSHRERQSNSPAVSSTSRSTLPDSDQHSVVPKETKIVHRLPPALKKQGGDPVEPRPPMLSRFSAFAPKSKDLPATSTTSNIGADQKHAPHSIPQLSSTSSLYSQVHAERLPFVSTSVVSQSPDTDPQQQSWKNRIILLAQVQEIIPKMSEINHRLKLRTKMESNLGALVSRLSSNGEHLEIPTTSAGLNLSTLAPSNGPNLKTPAPSDGMNLETLQNKSKVLEEKLNPVVSQLMEEDIWPLPTQKQSDLSVEQHQLYLSSRSAEFDRRLDLIETQTAKIRQVGRVYEGQSVEEEGASRASKRRRVAGTRFVQAPFNPLEVLVQLDRLQSDATFLEAETLHEERLLELVDERAKDWLLERPVVPPVPDGSLQDAVRKLDADLDILCGELADTDTDNLASQVGTLRLETGDMMQAVDLLASEMQSVQLREADLGQRTQKILEELIELGRAPQDQTDFTDGYNNSELTVDVQQHIDTAMAQIHSTIRSHHEEIKNTVMASLEPTILKAEAIYRSFTSQPEAAQS